jgi:multidrug/hemolysin transport system permease protein
MFNLTSLIKRNVKVFLRDKAAVFFSFLSVIILLSLYFLFIGAQYTSGNQFRDIDENLKTFLRVGVIMGGVLVINTVSLSFGVMGTIISDIETRRLEGFMVTPIERYKVIFAYIISSTLVTMVLSLLMWFLTILYLGLASGYWYSFQTIILASLLISFYTFISSGLMLFLVTLIKSQNAFGALAGVLGTVIGFMSGIYIPLSALDEGIAKIASILPFTHMTILLKQLLLKDAYAELTIQFAEGLAVPYGSKDIGLFGLEVPMFWLMMASLGMSLILLILAYHNMNKKMVK